LFKKKFFSKKMVAPNAVFVYQALVSCISILLKVDPAYDWVICPGSTNCLCPEGFTGQTGGAQPRCLKFATANQFCDPKTLITQVSKFFKSPCKNVGVGGKGEGEEKKRQKQKPTKK
jgi:hypothetical protein